MHSVKEKILIGIYGHEAYLPYNQPEDYKNLTDQEKTILAIWIDECLKPFETRSYSNRIMNSYVLKHRFQFSNIGFYVTNGQFKGAMLAAGFEPKDYEDLNWTFKLGKRAAKVRDVIIPEV